jgi:hypothetical protein
MRSFPAKRVEAIRCTRIVCVIKADDLRAKALQVIFPKDGSLFISFPYFRHRTGLLSASYIPADGQRQSQISLEQGGKVTSHLVKYSHHRDGRAQFSQDGKIYTAVKRQSVPLDKQEGHIFSLMIQGLHALEPADPVKDAVSSARCRIIDFEAGMPEAVKIVGRWYDVNRMRSSNPDATIGPLVETRDPGGAITSMVLVASPHPNVRHVLALTCVPIPKLGPAPEIFVFCGGFDPPEMMTNPTRPGGFLAFLYPIAEADKTRERLGSVDYHLYDSPFADRQ